MITLQDFWMVFAVHFMMQTSMTFQWRVTSTSRLEGEANMMQLNKNLIELWLLLTRLTYFQISKFINGVSFKSDHSLFFLSLKVIIEGVFIHVFVLKIPSFGGWTWIYGPTRVEYPPPPSNDLMSKIKSSIEDVDR